MDLGTPPLCLLVRFETQFRVLAQTKDSDLLFSHQPNGPNHQKVTQVKCREVESSLQTSLRLSWKTWEGVRSTPPEAFLTLRRPSNWWVSVSCTQAPNKKALPSELVSFLRVGVLSSRIRPKPVHSQNPEASSFLTHQQAPFSRDPCVPA